MQIVIDIPEEVKNQLGFGVTYSDDIQAICEAIENSTSLADILDKIRDEIERDSFNDVNGSKYIFVNRVNRIIDKYKAESEE